MNNTKQFNVFREFRGQIISVEVDYDNKVEMDNTTDSISGVHTGSGKDTKIYTNSPQDFVESQQIITTR